MRIPTILFSLCAVGCAISEIELGETELAVSASNWTTNVAISGQYSDMQVGLAYQGGRTYRVNTADDSTELRYARFNGTSWSTEQIIVGQRADYAPALATFEDRVHLVYKEDNANRMRMSTYFGGTWQPPTTAGSALGLTTIASSPSLAVHEGFLYMAYCRDAGPIDYVQIDRYDGSSWTSVVSYPLVTGTYSASCHNVAIGSLPSRRFDIVVRATLTYTGGAIVYDEVLEITGTGTPTSAWVIQDLGRRSKRPLSIVYCGGRSHLVHGGYASPETIYWTQRTADGWPPNQAIPNQASNGGPALVCHDTRTLMVHNNTHSAATLYMSEFIE